MDLLEVCGRAQQGGAVSKDSFDLDSVYANLVRLVDKYGIKNSLSELAEPL